MEIEEAIKICEDFIEENKDRKIILHTAIQTVLQGYEDMQNKKDRLIQKNIEYDKTLEKLQKDSIPKKKIEDLLEEVYIDEGIGYELDKDEKPGAIRVLKKLLKED